MRAVVCGIRARARSRVFARTTENANQLIARTFIRATRAQDAKATNVISIVARAVFARWAIELGGNRCCSSKRALVSNDLDKLEQKIIRRCTRARCTNLDGSRKIVQSLFLKNLECFVNSRQTISPCSFPVERLAKKRRIYDTSR